MGCVETLEFLLKATYIINIVFFIFSVSVFKMRFLIAISLCFYLVSSHNCIAVPSLLSMELEYTAMIRAIPQRERAEFHRHFYPVYQREKVTLQGPLSRLLGNKGERWKEAKDDDKKRLYGALDLAVSNRGKRTFSDAAAQAHILNDGTHQSFVLRDFDTTDLYTLVRFLVLTPSDPNNVLVESYPHIRQNVDIYRLHEFQLHKVFTLCVDNALQAQNSGTLVWLVATAAGFTRGHYTRMVEPGTSRSKTLVEDAGNRLRNLHQALKNKGATAHFTPDLVLKFVALPQIVQASLSSLVRDEKISLNQLVDFVDTHLRHPFLTDCPFNGVIENITKNDLHMALTRLWLHGIADQLPDNFRTQLAAMPSVYVRQLWDELSSTDDLELPQLDRTRFSLN